MPGDYSYTGMPESGKPGMLTAILMGDAGSVRR